LAGFGSLAGGLGGLGGGGVKEKMAMKMAMGSIV
jgi:hypothetical protein